MRKSDHSSGSTSRWAVWLLIVLIGAALLRIGSTYSVFNQTFDEVAHIAVGMEWLDAGTYRYETQHPPMRAVYAIGPKLLGLHHLGESDMWNEGRRILYTDGQYWRNLTAARVAALPFFILTVLLIFIWARRLAGPLAGVFAALAYTTLPLALAHAGLATTDTLLTATNTLALFAWAHWLNKPTRLHTLLLGAAVALAILSKFSSILFLGVVISVTGILWLLHTKGLARNKAPALFHGRLRLATTTLVFGLITMFALIWAGYRFSFEPMVDPVNRPYEAVDKLAGTAGPMHDWAYGLIETPVPAQEFVRGIQFLVAHNDVGHTAYFMGDIKDRGNYLFFPIGILIKTPIPFLLLMLGGVALLLRRGVQDDDPLALIPPVGAILIILACIPSAINIGLRHILPIFPLLAIGIGVAAAKLWQTIHLRMAARSLLVVLLAWQIGTGVRAHPDYLAYFNECCDSSPQAWMGDSDLDWGQDLARLSAELHQRDVTQLHIAYFGSVDLKQHGLPPFTLLKPYERVSGWVAISEMRLTLGTQAPPYDQYAWLRDYQPVTRIGKSIRLYWIP